MAWIEDVADRPASIESGPHRTRCSDRAVTQPDRSASASRCVQLYRPCIQACGTANSTDLTNIDQRALQTMRFEQCDDLVGNEPLRNPVQRQPPAIGQPDNR